MAKKFIKQSNMPPRLGLLTYGLVWLLLERFGAPGWLYGVVYVLLGLGTIIEICRAFTDDGVDLVGNDKK